MDLSVAILKKCKEVLQVKVDTFLWLMLLLCSALVSGCYSMKVGYEFSRLYLSADNTDELVLSDNTSKKDKEFIEDVNSILDYANKNGLDSGGSYNSMIFLDRGAVSYGVTAAEKLELKQKKWWYLFVGSVPYRAFFC